MKVNHRKTYLALCYGDKIPRKSKKLYLGKRISKSELNRKLKSVKIIKEAQTCYEMTESEPNLFCPKCGNEGMVGTGNRVAYPEHWEDFHCTRCRNKVAYIDNSPTIHALQCKNFELPY